MPFSTNQMRAIEVSERTMSVFSLIGSLFIISTFIAFPFFRKPINRLVFYASIGNILCNTATLISTSGLDAGESSSLCQFQGVLIQWFIPADSLWTFCMALNVYLTFFKNYTASNLRSLEKWYLLFCYGVPFVPALVYLLLDAGRKYGIYGPATIWCWVSVKWDWMRIAFFYGPVWIVIGVTTTIYVITGKDIFKQRAALRAFSKNSSIPLPVIENPFTAPNLAAVTKVTEIRVTSETVRPPYMTVKSPSLENDSRSSFSSTRKLSSREPLTNQNSFKYPRYERPANWPYKAHITADKSHIHDQNPSTECITTVTVGSPVQATEGDCKLRKTSSASQAGVRRRNNAAMDANTAAWGYAKVAMLMFVALIIVWVPSTVNRVYSLVHPDHPLYVLNLMSALVLPLQGFWNAMIYIATSWSQCGIAVQAVFGTRQRRSGSPTFSKSMTQVRQQHNLHRQKRQDSTGEMNTQDAMDMDPHFDLQDIDVDVDVEHMVIKTVPRERQASDPFNKHDSTAALPLSPRKS